MHPYLSLFTTFHPSNPATQPKTTPEMVDRGKESGGEKEKDEKECG